jgi:hypothetical protein
MQRARLKLVGFRAGFRPGHVRGVRDAVPGGIARCRDGHACWLRASRAWRLIIRARGGRLQLGRLL